MKIACFSLRTLTLLAASTLALAVHAQAAEPAPEPQLQAHAAQLQERAQARAQARQEIAQQRAHIQAQKAEGETACWQRFSVDSCLRDVRAQAREQDSVLHRREIGISHEERQEKASERLRAIAQKKSEKQANTPLQSSVRGAVPAATATADPAAVAPDAAAPAPAATEGDAAAALAATQAERASAAQTRAAEQAARVGQQQTDMAERQLSEAERRVRVKKNMQDKQQAAQARRDSKADEIAQRKGAPLPIPADVPAP